MNNPTLDLLYMLKKILQWKKSAILINYYSKCSTVGAQQIYIIDVGVHLGITLRHTLNMTIYYNTYYGLFYTQYETSCRSPDFIKSNRSMENLYLVGRSVVCFQRSL